MKRKTYNILKIATLPLTVIQNLVGCFVWVFCKLTKGAKLKKIHGYYVFLNPKGHPVYGVSLGLFIFVSEGHQDITTVLHEHGHRIQSIYFGLLYLPLVGLPSALSNIPFFRKHLFKKDKMTTFDYYYCNWWERQADRQGGLLHIVNEQKKELTRIYES